MCRNDPLCHILYSQKQETLPQRRIDHFLCDSSCSVAHPPARQSTLGADLLPLSSAFVLIEHNSYCLCRSRSAFSGLRECRARSSSCERRCQTPLPVAPCHNPPIPPRKTASEPAMMAVLFKAWRDSGQRYAAEETVLAFDHAQSFVHELFSRKRFVCEQSLDRFLPNHRI